MRDMSQVSGGDSFMRDLPESLNLVVNVNHPLISRILSTDDVAKRSELIKQSTDLALLAQGLLKGEALTKFIKRSVSLID